MINNAEGLYMQKSVLIVGILICMSAVATYAFEGNGQSLFTPDRQAHAKVRGEEGEEPGHRDMQLVSRMEDRKSAAAAQEIKRARETMLRNTPRLRNCTSLYTAVVNFDVQAVQYRLLCGDRADKVVAVGVEEQQRSPLHKAAGAAAVDSMYGLYRIRAVRTTLDQLLQHRIWNLNVQDETGMTPLMHAVDCASDWPNKLVVMLQLIEANADVACCNFAGQSAITLACKHADREAVKLLLDHSEGLNVARREAIMQEVHAKRAHMESKQS